MENTMTDMSPIVVKLSRPVVNGKDTFSEITFAAPMLGKDLVAMDAVQGNARKDLAVYASMSNVPLPVILNMTVKDITRMKLATRQLTMGEQEETAEDAPAAE